MKTKNYITKARIQKKKGFSAQTQLREIQKIYPDLKILRSKGNSFEITFIVQPTSISRHYEIKLRFDKYEGVKVNVINEILAVAANRKSLPHVYSTEKQTLCLYSPSKDEWNREKLISVTILPWVSDWLFYYELWLIDGNWLGGGHDEYAEGEK